MTIALPNIPKNLKHDYLITDSQDGTPGKTLQADLSKEITYEDPFLLWHGREIEVGNNTIVKMNRNEYRTIPWGLRFIGITSKESPAVYNFEGSSEEKITHYHLYYLYNRIIVLFNSNTELYFEDGVENTFSKELYEIISHYGTQAINFIWDLIINEKIFDEIASEALRWLGLIEDPMTYEYRFWLMVKSLKCSSYIVRDGAVVGLSYLNDARSITYLKTALQTEIYPELRNDMNQVLKQLESP